MARPASPRTSPPTREARSPSVWPFASGAKQCALRLLGRVLLRGVLLLAGLVAGLGGRRLLQWESLVVLADELGGDVHGVGRVDEPGLLAVEHVGEAVGLGDLPDDDFHLLEDFTGGLGLGLAEVTLHPLPHLGGFVELPL